MSVAKVLAAFYERSTGKQGGRKRHDFWTPAKIDKLRAMVSDPVAYSATQIGVALGCSRCAVIGKVYRLGLSFAVTRNPAVLDVRAQKAKPPSKDHGVRTRAPALSKPAKAALVQIDGAKIPPIYKKPLMRLKPRDCRYPFGDPKEKGFGFCGAETPAGSSFCPAHRALCYTAPRERTAA